MGRAGIREVGVIDAISRSMRDAPPRQTMDEWARTTNEVRLLILMRELTAPQQEAWLRGMRRIVDGMPIPQATLLLYRECGDTEAEAAERLRQVLGDRA